MGGYHVLPQSNEAPVTEGVVVSISYSRVVDVVGRSNPRHPYNVFKIDGVFLKLAWWVWASFLIRRIHNGI